MNKKEKEKKKEYTELQRRLEWIWGLRDGEPFEKKPKFLKNMEVK